MNLKSIFLLALLAGTCVAKSSAETLALHANVELIDNSNSAAVQIALKSFRQDLQRRFGIPASDKSAVQITFAIANEGAEFDQHRVEVGKQGIVITGSDEIGLIHGIYAFSQDVLGIDPCIYFTGVLPPQVTALNLPLGTTESRPYTFKHRAMFVNDEDLIIGFQMEKQSYGMNMEFMEKLFETMLRLQMTGVIPSTLVLADEPHLKLASDMGLYIAQHHAEPLGSVPLYWPKNIPYSWSTHKEYFVEFWSDAIKRQAGKNVIWTLNFRGLLDRAFWDDDPSMSSKSSMAEKAKVVNDVIQTQYDLLKEITGEDHPLVCGYLWGELGGMYQSGLLTYPADTMLLFSDSGYGTMKDWGWALAENCELKTGIYQHVSYHNRRTHMRINTIHPDVFHREMKRAVETGMTEMIVLNVGNFKEKIFGIRQMVNYMNHFEDFAAQQDGEYYFDWYAQHQFGTTAPAVGETYRAFLDNQFQFTDPERKPGDEYYFYYVERLLNLAYNRETTAADFKKSFQVSTLAEFQTRFRSAEPKWQVSLERAYDTRRFLSGNALDFYNADLVFPTLKMMHLTAMASEFSDAVELYLDKEYQKSRLAAYQALRHAREALAAEKQIESAGWGRFADWYEHDETARTWHIETLLEHFIDQLEDLTYFNLNYHSRNPKTPGLDYKYQPGFESVYREELIYMNNAD